MTKGHKEKQAILDAYRDAYMQVHGTEPSIIEKKGGWFVINDGASKWRLTALAEMTDTLRHRAKSQGEGSGDA